MVFIFKYNSLFIRNIISAKVNILKIKIYDFNHTKLRIYIRYIKKSARLNPALFLTNSKKLTKN